MTGQTFCGGGHIFSPVRERPVFGQPSCRSPTRNFGQVSNAFIRVVNGDTINVAGVDLKADVLKDGAAHDH